jgi:hypothetical protein
MFLDIPLIRPQQTEQTEETLIRWGKDQIAFRYGFLPYCLEAMYEDGILTHKVPKKFFRYLSYHLWDRFITNMVSDYVTRGQLWTPECWGRVKEYEKFLAFDADRTELISDVDSCQGLLIGHAFLKRHLDDLAKIVVDVAERRNKPVYPYSFVEPLTEPAAPTP